MYVETPKNEYESEEDVRPKKSLFVYLKRLVWFLIIVVVIVLGYIGVHFASAYRTIVVGNEGDTSWKGYVTKWLTKEEDEIKKEENRLDVLLLGIRGEDNEEAGGYLTDTILLISIDKVSGRAAMISIPRDLYIEMDGKLTNGDTVTVHGKVNEIYVRGLEHSQGLTFASRMFTQITGVYIDNAILFDFKAFEKLIDTLGGVDVYLARPFSEKTQWGYEFTLPAGANHLNSEQALYYVRSRFSSSDFDRARRQQEVILAIKKRATELGFLANPTKITDLMDALKGNVRTNFQIWEIKDLISLAQSMKNDQLKKGVLSTDNLLYETHLANGEYVL